METNQKKTVVTVQATVNAPAERVWRIWHSADDIVKWNTAHPDWHTPWAKLDLRNGGSFVYRMETKDGSMGFDFGGTFDVVQPNEYVEYTMSDGRKVQISFERKGGTTHIVQKFDAENQNPVEMQRDGWQAILNSFKKYVESSD